MSWVITDQPYQAFQQIPGKEQPAGPAKPLPTVSVWETNSGTPGGKWEHTKDIESLSRPSELKIVFAPLDLTTQENIDTLSCLVQIFHTFAIPDAFAKERELSVSHSFGTQADTNGFCVWFHFLCKNIRLKSTGNVTNIVHHDEAAPRVQRMKSRSTEQTMVSEDDPLPQADYSYLRSGFFLQHSFGGNTTLVCFGASINVFKTIQRFISNGPFDMVSLEPMALFDLVLEGIFFDVDNNIWNMAKVFGPLEHKILTYANSRDSHHLSKTMPFADLHNISKHTIHLHEALTACLLLVDGIISRLGMDDSMRPGLPTSEAKMKARQKIRHSVEYRKSLFLSTKMRLSSLQQRIDNIINLSFNLVTQQDSNIMINDSKIMAQDSNSMKAIAGITMLFLPATAVASILGSQLFEDNAPTPLFTLMWWVIIPLTVVVFILAYLWRRWTARKYRNHHRDPEVLQAVGVLRRQTLGSFFSRAESRT